MIKSWLLVVLLSSGLSFAAEKSGGIADPDQPKPPPATVGTDKEAQPSTPAKGVEEPVFQLPDLVIIGENQARIMAQKEALTGSPLQGLHEAPLLEKEESSVAALRRREPAPVPYPTRTGTGGLLRLEGGNGGAFLGAGWIGRQTERSLLGLEFNGARILGEQTGNGNAGGWEAGARFHSSDDPPSFAFDPLGIRKAFDGILGGQGEHLRLSIGLGVSQRELPQMLAMPDARRNRWSTDLDVQGARTGWLTEFRGEIRHASVEAPGFDFKAELFESSSMLTLASWRSITVIARPRLEFETSDGGGDPSLLGLTAEAAWVPGERIRGVVGIALDGVSWERPGGTQTFSGLASPVAGLAWTMPTGTLLTARFAPRLAVPWVARDAVASPYSVFGASTIPERTLADLRVAARQERRDGSHAEVAYRLRESRLAPSWWERPGEGLFSPAVVGQATVHEGRLSVRAMNWRPWSVRVEAVWRDVITTGGAIANLPESEGIISAEYPWRTVTFGASVEIARSRPGSISGALLPAYGDLGLRAEWAPFSRLSVLLAGSNLGGADVQRWAGYPAPRRLLTIGARATF